MVTSSAVVGSSAISSFGLQASAMAIITRWRMPPENWCGIGVEAPLRIGDADQPQHIHGLLPRAPRGSDRSCSMIASPIWSPIVITGLSELIGSWKIMAMSRPRISGILLRGRSSRSTPLNSIRPRRSVPAVRG